jgi:hypothetical protein
MSYDLKIARTKEIIDGHNNSVAHKRVEFETFLANLQNAGGTTDEALKYCTWEDLEKFGLPTLIAKQVANVFRTKEDGAERKAISEKKAQLMTPSELLTHYDPRNWDTFVGKRLKEIVGSKRCLVYNGDGSVNVSVSAKLVEEIRDGFDERDIMLVDDHPYKVYQIGERPDQFAFENPLYPGTLLRPDETCDKTNLCWAGVAETLRVLVYLATKETKEYRVINVDSAHNLFEMLSGPDAEKKFRRRYPKASLMYEELKKNGNLPTLRLSRNQRPKNDPFYGVHKRF